MDNNRTEGDTSSQTKYIEWELEDNQGGLSPSKIQGIVDNMPDLRMKEMLFTNVRHILDALPFYAMLVDEDHRILMANKTVEVKLGFDPDKIVGKYCPKVIHGYSSPYPGCPLEDAVKEGHAVEKKLYDKPSKRWLSSAVYPIENIHTKKGKKIYLHFARDITEQERLEKQKKEALDQIERNIEQFAVLVDNIRNYLAVIVGVAELEVEDKEASQKILGQAKRIEEVIDELDKGWLESEDIREFLRSTNL